MPTKTKSTPSVTLEPLAQANYQGWFDHCLVEYAKDKQKTHGYSDKDARELATTTMNRALPDGLATPDNYIFKALNQSGKRVGTIWVAVQTHFGLKTAFIYDIEINEAERGKGYGRATMRALEEKVRELNIETISLHVFAFNKPALALYESLGFQVTDYSMSKAL